MSFDSVVTGTSPLGWLKLDGPALGGGAENVTLPAAVGRTGTFHRQFKPASIFGSTSVQKAKMGGKPLLTSRAGAVIVDPTFQEPIPGGGFSSNVNTRVISYQPKSPERYEEDSMLSGLPWSAAILYRALRGRRYEEGWGQASLLDLKGASTGFTSVRVERASASPVLILEDVWGREFLSSVLSEDILDGETHLFLLVGEGQGYYDFDAGGSVKLYVDNVLAATQLPGIGGVWQAEAGGDGGDYSDLIVWDRALTSTERGNIWSAVQAEGVDYVYRDQSTTLTATSTGVATLTGGPPETIDLTTALSAVSGGTVTLDTFIPGALPEGAIAAPWGVQVGSLADVEVYPPLDEIASVVPAGVTATSVTAATIGSDGQPT